MINNIEKQELTMKNLNEKMNKLLKEKLALMTMVGGSFFGTAAEAQAQTTDNSDMHRKEVIEKQELDAYDVISAFQQSFEKDVEVINNRGAVDYDKMVQKGLMEIKSGKNGLGDDLTTRQWFNHDNTASITEYFINGKHTKTNLHSGGCNLHVNMENGEITNNKGEKLDSNTIQTQLHKFKDAMDNKTLSSEFFLQKLNDQKAR